MIEPNISIQDFITQMKPVAIDFLKSKINTDLDNFMIYRVCVDVACLRNEGAEYKSIDKYFIELEPGCFIIKTNPYWEEDFIAPAAFVSFYFREKKGNTNVKDTEAVEQ